MGASNLNEPVIWTIADIAPKGGYNARGDRTVQAKWVPHRNDPFARFDIGVSGPHDGRGRGVGRRQVRGFSGPVALGFCLSVRPSPVLLLGGWAGSLSAEHMGANTRALARAKVELVAQRISTELAAQLNLVEALSSSTTLDSGTMWRVGMRWMTAVYPADRDVLDLAVQGCLRSGDHFCAEFRVATKAGGQRWIRATGRVLPGEDEQPESIQGVMDDITPRKRAEAERLDLLRRVAQAQEEETRGGSPATCTTR